MKGNIIFLSDKNGYEYPFVCIPVENLHSVVFSKAELDYTFALVTINNEEINDKYLIGKVTNLTDLPEKLHQEIDQCKPTHLLLYHGYVDIFIIDKNKLANFGFKKVWY